MKKIISIGIFFTLIFANNASIGAVTIDGKIYNQIAMRPEIPIGKMGIGLDLYIYIDGEGNFYKESWDFSNTKAVFGFQNETNIGMIFYTSLQSAPCFIEDMPVLIPFGVDQDPHFRITRDIAPKINKPKPALIHNIMIPALGGPKGKMSASNENETIYTTDSPEVVRKKINKYAFSGGQPDIEEHRKKGGNPDIDVSYQYLKIFFEPDDKKLEQIHDDYKSGKMLTGELKEILIEKINQFLTSHQQKREKAKDELDKFLLKD